ncbi:MAG: hypothetical protein FJ025_00800 [Chloroflexi bacterium]|nr:hypothetical protein [Chloroflexota bacterium]
MTTTPTPTPVPTPQPAQQAAVKTWKPITAGILTLIAGTPTLIIGILISIGTIMGGWMMGWMMGWMWGWISAAVALPIVLGIISIIGGVFALQRRVWGMALAGAICALPTPAIILGILAIIFVSLSKKEFA